MIVIEALIKSSSWRSGRVSSNFPVWSLFALIFLSNDDDEEKFIISAQIKIREEAKNYFFF